MAFCFVFFYYSTINIDISKIFSMVYRFFSALMQLEYFQNQVVMEEEFLLIRTLLLNLDHGFRLNLSFI